MKLVSFIVAVLLTSYPVFAQSDFNLDDAVAQCSACHGESGLPDDPEIPIIWGQQFFYTYTQLKDFAAGRRQNDTMTPMAEQFSRDEMKEIAQYFADKEWPSITAQTQDGDEQLAERGMAQAECSACHGKWQGDSRIPRLAGQHSEYLDKTMLDLKSEERANAPDMSNLMAQLDENTIGALARYLASLRLAP